MAKGIVVQQGLSPDEQALLQLARDLGIVGTLLEEARKRDEEKKKKVAYDRALTIATNLWQQAITNGAKTARIEVTVEVDGATETAVYPAPVPKSHTIKTKKTKAYPDGLVEALKEEARRRGAEWYGVQNAIRTKWGKEIYEQYTTSATSADSASADSATA